MSAEKLEKKDFIPVVRPCIGPEEKQAVLACLDSGWITSGPRAQEFEEALSQRLSGRHVLALSSNTAGLYIALKALGIGPGDEVITPSLTFAATPNVIEWCGARAVFCDVCPESGNITTAQIKKVLTDRTKAIMPVHFAGLSCDMTAINALAKENNLRVIEDAAHAMGTSWQGQSIGSFGDIQVFSFHANKPITTAEGGALVTEDQALFEKCKRLAFHGFSMLPWQRQNQSLTKAVYDVTEPGLKFNITDIQAALGVCQLKKEAGFKKERQRIARHYIQNLSQEPALILPKDWPGHCWHLFGVRIKPDLLKVARDDIRQLLKDKGVGTSVHYPPAHLFSYYQKKYNFGKDAFPDTESLGRSCLTLPLFPGLQPGAQDYVISALKEILKEHSA